MVKVLRVSKVSRQIRVVRVSKPHVYPFEREDSRIPSSVDSWLSSVPSIKETKVKEIPKTNIKQPSPIKDVVEKQSSLCRRRCVVISAVILVILIIGSIIGIILAVELQKTTVNTVGTTAMTTSH